MYKKIMVPVDLENVETLAGAMSVAAQLAEASGGALYYAGVHGGVPSKAAHSPEEYVRKLEAFVAEQSSAHTIQIESLPIYSIDPGSDLATSLIKAAVEAKMDLIVMASHMPGWAEHVFHSNAGYVACHAPMSVFVVR